ncbi:MAG: hypothetical protein M5R36_00035 [Deltaproteobacteria bacterium]|nr:hypothetical protein [Deltaproteobacteria bacterium]
MPIPRVFFSATPASETYRHVPYLGIALVAFACFSAWRAPREIRRASVAWLAAGALFAVTAIGPRFHWAGEFAALPEWMMPYAWLRATIPTVEYMTFPWRFILMTHLCFALSVGYGFSWMGRTFKGRPALIAAFVLLMTAETALFSGAPVPQLTERIDAPSVIRRLADQPVPGAVLDLPANMEQNILDRYVIYGQFHRRPVFYSNFSVNLTPYPASLTTDNIALQMLVSNGGGDEPDPRPGMNDARELGRCLLGAGPCDTDLLDKLDQGLGEAASAGIAFVVLHTDLLRSNERLYRLCPILFGAPIDTGGNLLVFRVAPPFGVKPYDSP